jgi:hypothetical protein
MCDRGRASRPTQVVGRESWPARTVHQWRGLARVIALVGVLSLKFMLCARSEVECLSASRDTSAGVAIAVCAREYERNRDPATGIALAKASCRAGNLAGAEAIARPLLVTPVRADALYVLGWVAKDQGRLDEATTFLERARDAHRAEQQISQVAADEQALAAALKDGGRFAEALRMLDRCITDARTSADRMIEGYCHLSAGQTLSVVGFFQAAHHEHLTPSAVRRGEGTRLQELLAQLQGGICRDTADDTPTDGFFVKILSFMLHPRQAALGSLTFEVDENPSGQAAAREPGAWVARGIDAIPTSPAPSESSIPEAIAIRIADLVVEKNRALFSADIRVDALVCTCSADPHAGHTSWTPKYSGIRDGERLSLENGLLFLGPVSDFVDITLWVSRDAEGSLELARLLAQRATSPEFKDAAAALLIGVGAVASPWVTAVGASTVLARIAYELVLGVAGKSIGLYRTSFLARERFGAGRHPPERLYRAQDFSFSQLIEPVTTRAA